MMFIQLSANVLAEDNPGNENDLTSEDETSKITMFDWSSGLFDNPEVYSGSIDQLIDNTENTMLKDIGKKEYTFDEPVNINTVQYSLSGGRNLTNGDGYYRINFDFKDEEGKTVGTVFASSKTLTSIQQYWTIKENKSVKFGNVKKVIVTVTGNNAYTYTSEIEVYGEYVKYEAVSDVVISDIGSNKAELSYKNPVHPMFEKNQILLNGKVIFDNNVTEKISFKDLQPSTKYTVRINAIYKDGTKEYKEVEFVTKEKEIVKPDNVTDVSWKLENDKVKLTYSPAEDTDYVNIYRDGKLVSEKNTSNEFIDGDLKPETKYEYLIVSFNAAGQSNGVKVEVTTPGKEVSNLKAVATEKEVSLTWNMPSYQNLEFARIYRQKEGASMFARIFKNESTYEPLFETNGTSFKDLTVKADTSYNYKVTTVDTKGKETDGKIITVKTKQTNVSGGGILKDENGDYLIKWTSPTTGKIKVLVGGVLYATVNAADQQIIIPKDKMKFDLIGNPDVQLIPVDENGNEGNPSKPGGGGGIGDIVGGATVGDILNPGNLLKIGMQLLALIGGFVLLGLAFRVVPKIVRMIRTAFTGRSTDMQINKRRVQE